MNNKRAVIYIRFSSNKQSESFSIEYQQDECRKFIELKGYTLVKEYVDKAKSGKKVAGREAFDEMLRDAKRGIFDKIIVFSFSRSFRNTRDALNYNHDLYEKHGIVIESVIERIDMTDPHGKFSGTNLFAMHELQSDIIAAHVKSGMYVAAQQGYYLGGNVPFGYSLYETGEFTRGKARRKFQVDENESYYIKQIYERYANGASLREIVDYLNDNNIKGRSGGSMTVQTITGILRNEFYIGIRDVNIKGYDKLKIEGKTPAIIDKDLFARVQVIHEKNAEQTKPRQTKRLYALTGKIFCKCGAHFFGNYRKFSHGRHYAYYVCSNKKGSRTCDAKDIRKDILEEYVLQEIKKHILNPVAIKEIAVKISHLANAQNNNEIDIKKLTARKTKILNILKNAKREQLENDLPIEIYNELSAEYFDELKRIEKDILIYKASVDFEITPENVEAYLTSFLKAETHNDKALKHLFDRFVNRIDITDDDVILTLAVCPVSRDSVPNGQPHFKLSLNEKRAKFFNQRI